MFLDFKVEFGKGGGVSSGFYVPPHKRWGGEERRAGVRTETVLRSSSSVLQCRV